MRQRELELASEVSITLCRLTKKRERKRKEPQNTVALFRGSAAQNVLTLHQHWLKANVDNIFYAR